MKYTKPALTRLGSLADLTLLITSSYEEWPPPY